ncbi:MAG: alpha-2-macroglobulin [Pirellulales bacterium]|nr:alpha-2-macroglobulin [Pirellulales bacterium]
MKSLVCWLSTAVVFGAFSVAAASAADLDSLRNQMQNNFKQGNFKDAYEGFRKLALDPDDAARLVGSDLYMAVQCLQRLNRLSEVDVLLEDAVRVHKGNWRLLQAAASQYMQIPHFGYIVAGKFERGQHRGGGRVVNSTERDRVRALQLMVQAMPTAMTDDDHGDVAGYLSTLGEMLLNNRGYGEAWRLQYLTDLNVLPDYEEGWGYGRQTSGAPVDNDGKPVFYSVPKTFESSVNDGQRWRWCLQQTAEMDPQRMNSVRMQFANFLENQFGVQTMVQWGWRFRQMETDDTREDESGTYALHTLGENETIARLATGIKRFELPDEFNYIKIYRQVADDVGQVGNLSHNNIEALEHLAQIFENRRQYPKAADYWRRLLKDYPNYDRRQRETWKQRLDQIVGAWGRFEPAQTEPAGRGATVAYRFRNGRQIALTAHEIKVEKLLDDVKTYIKSRPGRIDHRKINIGDVGHRLVAENQEKYLGEKVAEWKMMVNPQPDHFDKRVTIATPLQKPGAYLIEARMADGNTSFIVLWVDDTAIVKKQLENKTYYFVADAVSGKPVARANVEFFGWRMIHHNRPQRFEILTKQFAEYTDADGQVILGKDDQPNEYQWLATARTKDGRFAYLGFDHVWFGRRHDAEYNEVKAYAITDRPVYRPDQKVHYKFWVRHAKYDMSDTSEFAGREFVVEIHNPKGDKVADQTLKADAYGGIEGEYPLPTDATLGVYSIVVKDSSRNLGGGHFRVEEYKKPEYEVTVEAPERPVMLGDKITVTIKAKYYFGSPVVHAKVKYTVKRDSYDGRWYPGGPWDWLYGPGYWWFGYDYDWFPGWKSWGCQRPTPFWWPRGHQPPELVVDREVEIGEDGTVKVEIDTSVAQAIHPDQDHSYTITAEVVDQSRRTIVGTGRVLVARKPFKVFAWVDRGYFRVGDTIGAHFRARTLDGKPVEGRGELKLLKITYRDGKPIETPVQTWELDTNAEGAAHQQMTASESGQYRISYKLTSSPLPQAGEGPGVRADGTSNQTTNSPHLNPLPKGEGTMHTVEGGYLFTVIGEGFDGAQYRFNHLELIPDKKEYAPGDTIKLQINTARAGGTVLLFARPTNGVYLPPQIIRLDGKSTIEEIGVVQKDMPNFFVEAVTVADGRVYTESKEIVVPPEKRILNVGIEPSKEAYKPGEKAKAKIKLTDMTGEPFVGSTVVAIYDKSVEYISGGSNVPDIKEFFWKWRRHHHPQTQSSLGRWFGNMQRPKTVGMSDLGVFGGTVADEVTGQWDSDAMNSPMPGMAQAGFGGRGEGKRMAKSMVAGAPLETAAAPMMVMEEADKGLAADGAAEAPMVEPTVRTKFADTALWVGALTTAKDGTAEVSLEMPENLTTWRIKVWGMGQGTRVGQGFTDVVTRKDLIIRMEAPRFFVQTDEVVLSAIVHNYLKSVKGVKGVKSMKVELDLDSDLFQPIDVDSSATITVNANGNSLHEKVVKTLDALHDSFPGRTFRLQEWNGKDIGYTISQTVEVKAEGEARVDWRVKVLDEGEAVIRMKALTNEESDAMEQRFPCYIHGMLKMEAVSGSIPSSPRPQAGEGPGVRVGSFMIDVPAERRPKDSRLEVRFSPTLAGAMVDALPYLVDYPYGCTEQTLNRFLPTVVTQKILLDMKLDLKEIERKRTNLNAQEIGDDAERAKQWGRGLSRFSHSENGTVPFARNPVFNEDEVRKMVKEGVEALTEMQCSDGGWGWFSGWGEHSSPHTTALVVHGLQIARANDVALVPGMLEGGVQWLRRYQDEQIELLKNASIKDKPKDLRWKKYADNIDAFVYMVLVDAGVKNPEMLDFLYRDRTHLAVYAMAMYGLALEKQGARVFPSPSGRGAGGEGGLNEKLTMIMRNISQYLEQDDENQTAWLRLPGGYWWCWYGSEYESQGYYLKLLARTDPKGEVAPRLVKYLLNNRKHATYWNSTRDTAICVEAMADFIRASGEDRPEMTVEIFYDGKLQKAVEITPQNLFQFDNKYVLEGDAITSGKHTVELKVNGRGPLYYNGYLTTFTLEDFIRRAGLEIKVNRKYYKLVKVDKSIHAAGSRGQAVDQKVEKYERQELENLAELKSGDLVEIELEIDSKNDYEYLVFEDMKPSGFEPVELRSGYNGNDLSAYVEYRDNRVVFFARAVARGKHSVSYRMRTEIPGKFSALPTRGWAMYAPELKANSDEIKLRVED